MELKQRASLTAISIASFLSISKFLVGLSSGSMAVISSAIDSLLDIFMSFINFLAIKKADTPPDKNHLYGHGKVEDFAAIIQSVVIVITGGIVVFKAIEKFIKKSTINYSFWDIGIMVLSILVSFYLSSYLNKISKLTNSNALKADALHYSSDLYSNAGVLISVGISFYTKIHYFDFIFALIIGVIIIFSSLRILKRGIYGLTDISLSEDIIKKIDEIVDAMPIPPYAGYHKLRTRISGSKRFIDFHLLVCRKATIHEAHELANNIEKKIDESIKDVDIMIHIEPCPYVCELTNETCRVLKMRGKV